MEHQLEGVLSKLLAFDKTQLPQIDHERKLKPQLIIGMSAEEYHGDRTRINSSALKKILESPRRFLAAWRGKEDVEDNDHLRFGRAAHMMLLEPQVFRERFVVEPVHAGVTKGGEVTTSANAISVKEAKKKWQETLHKNAMVVSSEELSDLVGIAESVIEHPIASGMLKNGHAEVVIHWTDQETGVMCKARPDFVTFEGGIPQDNFVSYPSEFHLLDFKTAKSIDAGLFAAQALALKYHYSLAFYAMGLLNLFNRLPSTIGFIASEKFVPWETALYPLEDQWYEQGHNFMTHALRLYAKCLAENKWPAYSNTAQMLSIPSKAKFMSLPEFDFESENL